MKQNNIKSLKSVVKSSDAHLLAACEACDKVVKNGFAFVSESLEPAFIDCCEASSVPVLSMDAAESAAGEVIVLYLDAYLTAAESDETEATACAQLFGNLGNVTVSERIRTAFEEQLKKCGYAYEIVDAGVTESGVVYCYVMPESEPIKDETDETPDEVEATETETTEETAEQTDERKPSALSTLIAKVASKAKAVASKAAFFALLAVTVVLVLLTMYVMIVDVINPVFEILNPSGLLRVVLAIVCLFTLVLDTCVFVEVNFLAVVAKIFPSMFWNENKPEFMAPRSVIYSAIKGSL